MNTITSVTSQLWDIDEPTIAKTAEAIRDRILLSADYLSTPGNLLWIRFPDGKGIGVQNYGSSLLLSPGFFEGDFLYVFGLGGSELVLIQEDGALKTIARVIRRARKLAAVFPEA